MALPFRRTQYRGFTTVDRKKLSTTYDVDLVKQNLLNHFNTRKTERVRQPAYGSLILDYLFEIKNEGNVQKIVEDVLRIIQEETRVTLLDVSVEEGDYSVTINCDLLYIGTNTQFAFKVKFDGEVGIAEEVEDENE